MTKGTDKKSHPKPECTCAQFVKQCRNITSGHKINGFIVPFLFQQIGSLNK